MKSKDRVISVEIRFRISRLTANPKSRLQDLNPDFPSECTLFNPTKTIKHQNFKEQKTQISLLK